MARKTKISVEARLAIFTLWQEKIFNGTNCIKIRNFFFKGMECYKKEETVSVVSRKLSGHHRITYANEDRRTASTSKRNRLLTVPEIKNGVSISRDL